MASIISENFAKADTIGWIVASASKCSITESKLFESLVVSTILGTSTEKPSSWKVAFSALWRVVSILLWVILILVVLSSIGRHLAFAETSIPIATPKADMAVESGKSFQAQEKNVQADLDSALIESRKAALGIASDELDTWVASLMKRVDDPENDNDFLDWYFGYWTQEKFGLDAVTTWGTRIFNKKSPTAKEKIQEIVLQEFTSKVFRPEIAKLELKAVSRDVAQVYTDELQRNFEKVRVQYNFPKGEWDSYLQDLARTVIGVDGRQIPIGEKAITVVGGVASVGGSVLVAKGAVLATEKMTALIGAKVASKAAASLSTKLGAFGGGSVLGPAVAIALVAWDVVDLHNTEVKKRPELRRNIEDYFDGMKGEILADRENGIQKVILDIETSVRKGMSASHFPFLNF